MRPKQKVSKAQNAIAASASEVEQLLKKKEEMQQIGMDRQGAKRLRSKKKRKSDVRTTLETRTHNAQKRGKCRHCGKWLQIEDFASHTQRCSRKKLEKFQQQLSKCQVCQKSFLKDKLPKHMTVFHSQTTRSVSRNLKIYVNPLAPPAACPEPKPAALVQCHKCNGLVVSSGIKLHMRSCDSPEEKLRRVLLSAHRLPFQLLPPGIRLQLAIEQFRNISHTHASSLTGAHFDWDRLDRIDNLGPVARRYVGLKEWKGYVLFEFGNSDRVVLECPVTDNATYVIRGEWRHLVMETKARLRSEYSRVATRIIHTNSWEDRVRSTVFIGKKPASLSRR